MSNRKKKKKDINNKDMRHLYEKAHVVLKRENFTFKDICTLNVFVVG